MTAGTVRAGARGHLGLSGFHPVRVRVIEREGVARGRREESGKGSTREVEVAAASKQNQQARERLEDQGRWGRGCMGDKGPLRCPLLSPNGKGPCRGFQPPHSPKSRKK